MPRANHIQKAERLNLARTLLQRYPHWPEAAQQLARKCSISERQAYRYLEQAQRLKHPVPVGDAKVSFTIKLSRRLVQRLRAYAASTGLTLSEIASRAFSAVLHRGEVVADPTSTVTNRPSGIPLRPIIAGQVGSGLRPARVGPVLVKAATA